MAQTRSSPTLSRGFTRLGRFLAPYEVMHIKHVLEMHDIACHIQGDYRSGAAGELPLTETWPELWVVDPSNVEEAKRLVAEALAPAGPAPPDWTCPSCHSSPQPDNTAQPT